MKRQGIFLPPGGGRVYAMGRISSTFLADGAETDGKVSILVGDRWIDAPCGSFVLVPGGMLILARAGSVSVAERQRQFTGHPHTLGMPSSSTPQSA